MSRKSKLSILVAIVTVAWSGLPIKPISIIGCGLGAMVIFNSFTSDDETRKILNVGRIPMPEGILFFFLLLAGATLGAKFGAYIVEQELQNIEHGNTFFIIASIGGAGGMVSAILLVLARLLWKKIAPDRYNKALKE